MWEQRRGNWRRLEDRMGGRNCSRKEPWGPFGGFGNRKQRGEQKEEEVECGEEMGYRGKMGIEIQVHKEIFILQ